MTVPIRQQKRAEKRALKAAEKALQASAREQPQLTASLPQFQASASTLPPIPSASNAVFPFEQHHQHQPIAGPSGTSGFRPSRPTFDPSILSEQRQPQQHHSPTSTSSSHAANPSSRPAMPFAGSPSWASAFEAASTASPHEDDTPKRVNEPGMFHSNGVSSGEKYVGPNGSQVLIRWLDEGSSTHSNLASHFSYAVSRAEEFTFPGVDGPRAPLPDRNKLASYLDSYFRDMHPLFPIVDEVTVRRMAANPNDADPLSMTMLHLIVSQGADASSAGVAFTEDGRNYLQQAWLALPSVLSNPYRTALQVVLLITIGLRTHHYEGIAWTFAGIATRLAFSLGLHHQRHGLNASLDARLFYACYVLDKQLSFESGRPSAINDIACTVSTLAFTDATVIQLPGRQPIDFFGAFVGICKELSFISSTLFSRGAVGLSTLEALHLIGKADQRLTTCIESLPSDLRPEPDGVAAADDLLPLVSRIHCMYFLAIITIHRLSLFDEGNIVTPMLNEPMLAPYAARLRASALLCVSAARSMLSTLERVARVRPSDRSWTCHCALSAIYVIAIRTWKHPESWQSKSDLMFLKQACEFTADRCRALAYPEEFTAHLPKLYRKVEKKVQAPHLPSQPGTRAGTPERGNGTAVDLESLVSGDAAREVEDHAQATAMTDSVDMADLWPFLLGDGEALNAATPFALFDTFTLNPFGLPDTGQQSHSGQGQAMGQGFYGSHFL